MNVQEDLRNVQELSRLLSEELGVRPTLIPQAVRAVRDHITWVDLPYPTGGRGPRLYGPEAVAVIREWIEHWKQNHAGRAKVANSAARFWHRVGQLEEAARALGRRMDAADKIRREIAELCQELRKQPMSIATSIQVLGRGLSAVRPIGVLVSPLPKGWLAAAVDVPALNALGGTPEAAVDGLRNVLVSSYLRLGEGAHRDGELWQALTELIRRKDG